ncbi:MAG: hypothetical protein Ct9H90mP25_2590 [Gammaproteobacteria bacterium]|nr:MAG: hypothetical protein Ct9H90mP25_2590 [Gammaproteobacteria bacterium]
MTSAEDVAGYAGASTSEGSGVVWESMVPLNFKSSSGYAQGEGNTGQYGGGANPVADDDSGEN